MADDEAHSKYSASSMARIVRCPGSVALCAQLPNRTSDYADEGTAAHTLAKMCFDNATVPDTYLGERIPVGNNTYEVTREMVDAIRTYMTRINSYKTKGCDVFYEIRVNYAKYLGVAEDQAWGTADCIILDYANEEIIVVDLKYGANPRNTVDAILNEQMTCYALGAMEEYSYLGDFKTARMVIVQPRCDWFSEWTENFHQLKLTGNLWGVSIKGVGLNPGEKQCQWCDAKYAAACPAILEEVKASVFGATALDDFDDLTIPDPHPHLGGGSIEPTADALGAMMSKIPLIEGFCKAVRAAAEARLFEGKPVTGYKLVEGKLGNRAWEDQTAAEAMLKTFRLKVEDMYDLSLISPTTAEKLSKSDKIGPKQWAKVQPMITRKPGSPSVAPESDKRPPLVIGTPLSDFDDQTGAEDLA